MKKPPLLVCLFILLITTAAGQTITITGKVTDKQTEEAIAFANVFIPGTTIGATTDFDGVYTLTLTAPADSLAASSIGYTRLAKKINPAGSVINFELERADYNLGEVVILPGENPAIPIIRKTVERKKSYDKRNLDSYGYEAYNKIEIDMNELTEKFKNRKIFEPFKFVFNNVDSFSEERPFLPFFLTETVSDFYYRKTPIDRREIIKASKVSGVNNGSVSQFLGTMYVEIDVYEDWITLLDRQFISPVSKVGLTAYHYYLVDSQQIDNFKCYKLQFLPKRKGELTFEGDMWIADSVFALKQISMKMSKDADVNFVRRLSLYNEFVPVKDSVWMVKKEKVVVDFIKPKNAPGLIGRKTASYKNFVVNESQEKLDLLFKKQKQDVTVTDSSTLRSAEYWNQIRHDSLSFNEQRVYQMIDTLRSLPLVKRYLDLVQTIYLGYKDVGPVSIGNIFSFISFNDVEGWRFKYGMTTSNKFSKYVMLGGYAAYGLRDRKIKYGAEFLWLLRKQPRESIGISYRSDISSTSNYNIFYNNSGLLTNFGIRRGEAGGYIPMKLVEVKELKVDYLYEFNFGYSIRLGFVNRYLKPLGRFNFSYQMGAGDGRSNQVVNDARASEITITHRFAWQEKFVTGEFNRLSIGSIYPIMFLQYGFGLRGLMHSDFNYHRLLFGISDTRKLGPLGKLYWNIEVGKTLGTLPYIMLNMPDVSETYIYNWSGMNTVRDYSFAADRYVKVLLDHHLGGILFNRIPGIRKLKWREVWTYRMWWGDMDADNKKANYANLAENPWNTGLVRVEVPDKVPLIEMGVGIENILRVIRIDAIWRVTHQDRRGGAFSFKYGNFGLRLGLQLQF